MLKPLILFFATIYFGECAYWENWSSNLRDLPCDHPVVGGSDFKRTYYVITANYGGGLLPGKYATDEKKAYVSFYNKEHAVYNFQVRERS